MPWSAEENAKAILDVVIGDALDETRQHLLATDSCRSDSCDWARPPRRYRPNCAAILKLLAAHLELEGDLASAAAFNRAVSFALDALHSHRDVN